jgi:uncharacterized protein (DUF433 family)
MLGRDRAALGYRWEPSAEVPMSLPIVHESAPLATDEHGVVRVAGTRVTLDTVVEAFDEGASPEEIAFRYPTLDLADVYATITYYLRHKDAVDAYLAERRQVAERVRRENERRFDTTALRRRLLARRAGG